MSTYQKMKLGEIANYKTGKLNSNAATENGDFPFFTCSRETFRTDTWSFDCECILLAGNNANAEYPIKYFPGGKFDAYQRTYVITPKDQRVVDIRYLYYVLELKLNLLKSISTGVTTKFLTMNILDNLEINLPDLKSQKRIVSVLAPIENLIENNTRRIAILEELARLIYREWFVHYRYPGHEEDKLVDSGTELGDVPKGWGVKKLKDFIKFKNGKSPKNQEGDLYPIYGANGIIGRCDEGKWENGVIIGRVGAYCGEVEYCEGKFWASDNTIVASSTTEYKFPLFDFYKLEDLKLRRYAGGSAQPLMTQTVIKEIQSILPSKENLEKFQILAQKLWSFKRNLEKKNQKLKETRDLLLPRMISGNLNIEKITVN